MSTQESKEELYDLIEDIDVAMMTTLSPDGSLVSRPMSTLSKDSRGHLWFMTSSETDKVGELAEDARINLAYYDGGFRGWVSVSGIARVTADRERIHELYSATWKMWLGDEGGVRDGGPDDPRIILLDVEIDSAVYFEPNSKPKQLFELVRAAVSGEQAELGETHKML